MTRLKLYLSSTFLDLEPVRKKILHAIQFNLHKNFELTDVMEMMRGDGENRSDIDICLSNVSKADVYLILMGKRLGSAPGQYTDVNGAIIPNTEEKSYTRLEYETACKVQKVKRYHIYKIELTDAFFETEKLDPASDLTVPGKKEKYERFKTKLNETVSAIGVDSINQLGKEVNDILTKSFLIFKTIWALPIGEEQACSIDRSQQVALLDNIVRNARRETNVVTIFLNTKSCEEDQTDLFSKKIRKMLRPGEDREFARKLSWVNANALAGSLSDDQERILDLLLAESSANIFGAKADFISFDKLYKSIEKENVQNRFLAFQIDLTTQNDVLDKFIQHIKEFIYKMNDLLKNNQFNYNFFVIVCTITKEELKNGFVSGFMPDRRIEHHDLGRLTDVELSDIEAWLESVINSRNNEFREDFYQNKMEIIKHIFSDMESFPKTYKQCLMDIQSRTK